MMPAEMFIPTIRIYPKRPEHELTGDVGLAEAKRRLAEWKSQTPTERVDNAATPPEDGFNVQCDIKVPEGVTVWLDGLFRFDRDYPLNTTLTKVWADIWDEVRKELEELSG